MRLLQGEFGDGETIVVEAGDTGHLAFKHAAEAVTV